MNSPLWIVWLSALSVSAYADEKYFDWVLERFEAKDEAAIASYSVGQMNGEQHLAIIARREDPQLVVFKGSPSGYTGVAQTFSLPLDSSLKIRKNSIFLETSFCHHGCTSERYQFKYVDGVLRLIGVESQRDTNGCYYDEKNMSSNCEKHEVRSGNSYNLVALSSICWLETTYVDDEAGTNRTPHKVPELFQPGGVKHKMALQRIDLPRLEGFDLYNRFSLPKSCYFDYSRKLHKE